MVRATEKKWKWFFNLKIGKNLNGNIENWKSLNPLGSKMENLVELLNISKFDSLWAREPPVDFYKELLLQMLRSHKYWRCWANAIPNKLKKRSTRIEVGKGNLQFICPDSFLFDFYAKTPSSYFPSTWASKIPAFLPSILYQCIFVCLMILFAARIRGT